MWKGRQSRLGKKTTGPEDKRFLVESDPSSQTSLVSAGTIQNESANMCTKDMREDSGTRRSSTSSGIGLSQGDSCGETSLTSIRNAQKPDLLHSDGQNSLAPLPILAPIQSSRIPANNQSAKSRLKERASHTSQVKQALPDLAQQGANDIVAMPDPTNWKVDVTEVDNARNKVKLSPIKHSYEHRIDAKRKSKHIKKIKEHVQNVNLTNGHAESDATVPLNKIHKKHTSPVKIAPMGEMNLESQA